MTPEDLNDLQDAEREEFIKFTVEELFSLGESWDRESAERYAKEQWEKGERL